MKILAFDCSLGPFSIALLDNDKVLSFVQNSQNKKLDYAKDFPSLINNVLKNGNLSFSEIERIVVTNGPGKFTCLRSGIAFARGLALSLSIRAIGIPSLDVIATGVSNRSRIILGVIVINKKNYYVQLFQQDGSKNSKPMLLNIDSLKNLIVKNAPFIVGNINSSPSLKNTLLKMRNCNFNVQNLLPDARILAKMALNRKNLSIPKPIYPLKLELS